MDEMEIQKLLKDAGWTLRRRTRRKANLEYLYAAKRIGGKVRETYIAPVSSLEEITKDEVLAKLAKLATK